MIGNINPIINRQETNMNYYEILGVTRNSSKEEITLAHKKLAMKLHPDRNPGDKNIEEKFKQVNKAYSILNNAEQKTAYDKTLDIENSVNNISNNRGNERRNQQANNFNKSNSNKSQNNSNHHNNSNQENFSNTDKIKISDEEWGTEDKKIIIIIDVYFWDAVTGGRKTFEFFHAGKLYTTELDLKPGVENGDKFTVSTPRYIFELVVRISKDENYFRNGLNLITHIDVPFHIAMLGGEIIFENYDGDVRVKIEANSKNDEKILVSNRGIKGRDEVGDLILIINLVTPTNLTDKQIELIKEFTVIESKKEKGLFFFKTAPFWEAIRKKYITT